MSITAISILAIAYLVLGILAFNPRVDDDYRAYYIEKTTSYWKPPRYSARVTDGIDFSKPGIPNFVASIFGVSYNESWGRWTDADLLHTARIVYKKSFIGKACISINASSSSKQLGRPVLIRIGEQRIRFIPNTDKARWYQFEINLPTKASVVEIEPTSPGRQSEWDRNHPDTRKIGIGLHRLVISPEKCG